jgi:DNA-binding transcriptional ArsR family regulator
VKTYEQARITVLGDPTRLGIFELLGESPRSVGSLAAELPISRPAVSQHLRVLKEAGLVVDRHEGTRRIYQLDPTGIAEIRSYFDRFWNHALANFKAVVEKEEESSR